MASSMPRNVLRYGAMANARHAAGRLDERRLAVSIAGYPVLHERYRYTLSALHPADRLGQRPVAGQVDVAASQRRPLPAILGADPTRLACRRRARNEWLPRWQGAVNSTAVRHRNLLTTTRSTHFAYRSYNVRDVSSQTLPLIVHADVTRSSCSLSLAEDERHSLTQSLRASLQQRHALDQIAKHV